MPGETRPNDSQSQAVGIVELPMGSTLCMITCMFVRPWACTSRCDVQRLGLSVSDACD